MVAFKRENTIAFAAGMKGSGKSQWLLDRFVSRAPRILHIDPNGEFLDDGDVLLVQGWPALLDALQACAKFKEWRIAVALKQSDMPRLFTMLAPDENFGQDSVSRAFGGISVECGEAYFIAPNGGADDAVTGAWMRGRHHLLSLLMGAQRYASVNRIVTSQSDHVAIFAQEESIDLDRVKRDFGPYAAADVAALEKWSCVYVERGTGYYDVLDPARCIVKRVKRLDGTQLSRR